MLNYLFGSSMNSTVFEVGFEDPMLRTVNVRICSLLGPNQVRRIASVILKFEASEKRNVYNL